jgi:histidinol dehydrogenase
MQRDCKIKIINSSEFETYWKNAAQQSNDEKTEITVKEIIAAVRARGDSAVREFASKFDKSSPQQLEVSPTEAYRALDELRANDPALVEALEFAARNIYRFALKQREQFADFEYPMADGLYTGQRVIPVQRAAVYTPAGRFPLFSTVLMGMIPALCAGVQEVILTSPPLADNIPDRKILAATAIADAAIAARTANSNGSLRIFAIGGAQAIAALALGTETVPRVDVIAGPGNKYVAVAKRLLSGEVGIDFIAGPTDVLIMAQAAQAAQTELEKSADLIAADMLAQAEHDPDAKARALVPNIEFAQLVKTALEKRLSSLGTETIARASIDNNGLIIIYQNMEEAIRLANIIAPEHLELQVDVPQEWIPRLINYGSLFIGTLAAEVLGDYSAGINHTLPTSGSARFTGGLSVRHFLKTVTTLRCTEAQGFTKAKEAAVILARAEGLEGHAQSAIAR